MILSLVGPYLPQPAQQFLHAFEPIINLLGNPAQFAWTAYNNPTALPGILVHTLSNVFALLRSVDLGSISETVQDLINDPGFKSLGDWVPIIVSAIAIFFSFRTLMGTMRVFTRMFSTLFRYGSLFGLAISAISWIMNAAGGGRGGAVGNAPAAGGLGDFMNSLGNAAAGGQNAGYANMARGFAGEMADAWAKGQKSTGKRSSSSARSTRSKKTKTAPVDAQAGAGAGPDLADMAQNWVKEAISKATMGEDTSKKSKKNR
jgi:hypothetical protein